MAASLKAFPLVMGIVNVTPDSFSGDGLLCSGDVIEQALTQAVRMVEEGADILDVGGESTRPGAALVSVEEEIRRVVPVVKVLHDRFPEIPISIDTTKPDVAEAAIQKGASIINDISGAAQEPDMRLMAVKYGVFLVLMHNKAQADATTRRPTVGGEYLAPAYEDVVRETVEELKQLALLAQAEGVAKEKIILDPGIGFGKTPEQNSRLIKELDQIADLGFPVLLAASRKSFIGRILGLPPEDRIEGTAAAVAIGVLKGASLLRVHDVKALSRVVRMAAAIRKS